jgi:hypothetical protein
MKKGGDDLLVTVVSVYRSLVEEVGGPYIGLQELQDLLRSAEASTDLEALFFLPPQGPSERLPLCYGMKELHQIILSTSVLPTELVRRKLLRVLRELYNQRRRSAVQRENARVKVQLEDAKETAVARFLMAPGVHDRPTVAAYAVSSKPAHNVVGVGIGRQTEKRKSKSPCIRLYVDRKLPKEMIPQEDLLPETINGVPTAVVESGRFFAFSSPQTTRRRRPAQPGDSIGFQYPGKRASWLMAGTLGALAQKGDNLLILSNNHVLADENRLPLGSPIFQPGLLDGGDPQRDAVALLTEFVTLRADAANEVDCAVAKVLDPTSVRAAFRPPVGRLKSAQPLDPTDGMPVEKVGRATRHTKGVVFDTSADVRVQYELGYLLFRDQILIRGGKRAFSAGGDSGAVVVHPESKRPVALLFGGSSTYTVASPLSKVLSVLGIEIRVK